MNVMPVDQLIIEVTKICKKNGVKRLDLFGSFATGTATPTSDIDFVVYGCDDIMQLEYDLSTIDTLRKIDIFDHDEIHNKYLLEVYRKIWKTNLLTATTPFAKVFKILKKVRRLIPKQHLFWKEPS